MIQDRGNDFDVIYVLLNITVLGWIDFVNPFLNYFNSVKIFYSDFTVELLGAFSHRSIT